MKLRLLTKLLLCILPPALLGLGVVAGLSYRSAKKALDAQIAEEMTLVVERQTSELRSVALVLREVVKNAAEGNRIATALRSAHLRPDLLQPLREAAQAQLDETTRNFSLIEETGLLDADGRILAHTNRKIVGKDRRDRRYYQTAMQGNPGVENLYSRSSKKPTAILSAPVMVDGSIRGVFYAAMDLATLARTMTDTIKLGRTGSCFVYNGAGTLLMHPNKAYIGDEDGKEPWVREILGRKNGREVYIWDGKEKMAYFRHIPEMDWYVVVAVEHRDLLTSITALLRNNLLVVAVSAVLVGLLIFFTARSITASLRGGARFVGHVAGGNLAVPPEMQRELDNAATRTDELGLLARGIRTMVDNLRGLFEESRKKTEDAEKATAEARQATTEAEEARKTAESAKREGMLAAAERLEEVANIVSSASSELSAQIEQSERGATEQAARLTETATAMEEMNSTVIEVAKNAGAAAEVSARTREKADSGAAVVTRAVESIRRVQQQSLALKEDMAALSEHAQSIDQIMGVISDIADQTNLLALNAAIEAARAGEAGRGFAVVADEVRKLAEKTMASTTDVGKAIKAIQNSAAQSVEQVDRAVQTIGEATDYANQSGEALKEIVSMADATADQVRGIATASEQQSASSEEISRSITQVNTIAADTARAMEEAAHAVSDLAAQARILTGLIEEMKRG